MPLDITGSYASSGSSGASARDAVRVSSDFTSTATSDVAASPVRDEKPREEVAVSSSNAKVAVFVSPFIRLDITSRLAIVEIRNSETGEVQQQYPSPRAVREYTQNLPEDSDLRSTNTSSDQSQQQPQIIGSDAAETSSAAQPTPGLQPATAPAPAPAAPAANPQAAAAAAAAFGSFQSVPTGGKQVAIA